VKEKQSFPVEDDLIGLKIHQIRSSRHLSLRELAETSGLSINTLSLVENGKSSPSVSTLHHLARALEVPITSFFESEPVQKQVVFTPHENRPQAEFKSARLENLAKDLVGSAVQPFVVTLPPKAGSGPKMIFHQGYEFVYCLCGKIRYQIDQAIYLLEEGDSLVFESSLHHCWDNPDESESQMILAFIPVDEREASERQHFPNQ
jgi:transcriptional regulator with XRE-family HTH domain